MAKFFRMGSSIIGFVGVLTIIISCMGLLGMVVYTIEGKLKEVGVRKVLGASTGNINWHLSKGFFLLLGIAILIAVPFTIFAANLWLQNFKDWFLLRLTICGRLFPSLAIDDCWFCRPIQTSCQPPLNSNSNLNRKPSPQSKTGSRPPTPRLRQQAIQPCGSTERHIATQPGVTWRHSRESHSDTAGSHIATQLRSINQKGDSGGKLFLEFSGG